MSILNNMPNVRVTQINENSNINLGNTMNRDQAVLDKTVGSSTTVGEHGISLDFQNNLFIRL